MKDELVSNAEERMKKALDALAREFARVRTSHATPALLDSVQVSAYGSTLPLNQVASVSVPEPRLLVVQPWDRTVIGDIEKAIQRANLGLNPTGDGNVIRIPIPPLTEERRKEIVRSARKTAEEARVSVRNIRRDINDQLKKMQKDKKISEDESHRRSEETQKLTDEFTGKIDELLEAKEKEIMQV
jgi:ribosome recycling factor